MLITNREPPPLTYSGNLLAAVQLCALVWVAAADYSWFGLAGAELDSDAESPVSDGLNGLLRRSAAF